jgi:hypothetical protein
MKSSPAKSSLGFTFGELLFSIAAVSLAALALSYSVIEFRQTELASRTVFTVVALDSALALAIVDPQNYQVESTKIALRSGRLPPSLVFHLKLPLPGGDQTVSVNAGETLALDRSLAPCKTYPIGDCGYKVRLNLDQHPPAFSYKVDSAFPEAALSVERSERNKVVIPKAAYRDPLNIACDPRREVGLSGLSSSEHFDCILKPQLACDRGTLPKALIVNPKTHSLEFECGSATKVARCPAYYAISKLNTKSLDAGESPTTLCVRTTASIASPIKQPAPAVSFIGQACPMGYKSDSSCAVVTVKSKPGRCGAGLVQPVPGKVRFTQNNPVGSLDCGVVFQTQSCGAVWEGLAQLKIKCVLDQPEFANAL